MKIKVNEITSRQILTIAKGLCDYQYIMDNWKNNDNDFQDVYYDFYLKARWAIMSKPENKEPYFKVLQDISPKDNLIDILKELKEKMERHSYEFSLGSKLLHTRNDNSPIYDSKVREYLSKEENVSFWWNMPLKEEKAPRGISDIEKIKHDWEELCNWYKNFLKCEEGIQWIKWFDNKFPTYSCISNIKKVDFIIFACE